ncbi:nucleotidyltransferase [Sinanaerobacter chloroacetimidivorans]|uniref:tRNA(Met) cytidine acetate ligase n=1 Tax=Sinanaerobacter chloroacetimidivorans TaxID=2818044 RepID=A0A8J7VZR9_9FIRM|nr:nucleotidyltransferase [Sinanaerobacter chloroacetimidivorans]MBR0596536.1 nucleotidyltransferase [Sinanaerobacter chloroacetimidivorans]
MNVLAIIAEYNPFHNGHYYHLKESVKAVNADYTICIMSGNFMQRGEPALLNKWIRSRMAVENGIDLVFELPFVFACNNAEYFAKGAVDILNRLGCVSHLSFGSEIGSITRLAEAANHLAAETPELSELIRSFADLGISYPKARYEALKEYTDPQTAEVLKEANNILGVEYLKQLQQTKSRIQPITIKRYGTGYHDKGFYENIASATAIRHKLSESEELESLKQYLPTPSFEVLNEFNEDINLFFDGFYKLLIYRILTEEKENLNAVLSATEGLENKVWKAAKTAVNFESMIKAVKSKRYTATRIQRLFTHILVNLNKKSFQSILKEELNYGRILAFNQKGAALLKKIKKEELSTIPILTNINRELPKDAGEWKLLQYDIAASDVYNLVTVGEVYKYSDYIMKPYNHFISNEFV